MRIEAFCSKNFRVNGDSDPEKCNYFLKASYHLIGRLKYYYKITRVHLCPELPTV
jgi:hypothetical protein